MSQETLTSRERVKKAVNHEPIDRLPIDLGMHFSTGISIFAYYNLREYMGLSTDNIEVVDCGQLLARVDTDIIDRFHVDTILLNPPWRSTHIWKPRGKYSFHVPNKFGPTLQPDGAWAMDKHGGSMLMPNGGFFFDGGQPNFYEMESDEKLEYFAKRAEQLYKDTDKYTLLMGFSAFFHGLDFACDMLLEPEESMAKNAKLLDRQTEYFNKVNKRYGKYINAIEINGDLGTQGGLMCTPSSYEQICYPYLKKFSEHVHQNSDIKLFMHACGSVSEALPYITDAKVDILNPVQISARNMDPQTLKQKFGDKICFWGGGVDTQTTLWQGTAKDVAEEVKKLVSIFKPNSGFVFNQVHNIMGNVPPENVIALYDTAYENGFY